MNDVISIGTHTAKIEEQILIVHFVDTLNLSDWHKMRELMEQVIATHGRVYVIGHVERAGYMAPEVRSASVEWMKDHPLLGFAHIKSKGIARALSVLLANAMRLLFGLRPESSYFDDEAQAREWIRELEQKRSPKDPAIHGRLGTGEPFDRP